MLHFLAALLLAFAYENQRLNKENSLGIVELYKRTLVAFQVLF